MILKKLFDSVIRRRQATHAGNVDYLWDALCEDYESTVDGKTLRYYHNINHIQHGVSELIKRDNLFNTDIDLVLVAWFYHDIVYRNNSKLNEYASGNRAFHDLIDAGWIEGNANKIRELIMWTTHDKNPPIEDAEANLLVDLDLCSIGSSPEQFAQNTRNIRKEYSYLTDKEWYKGRLEFWQRLLKKKKDKIFKTHYFDNLNEIALNNIIHEMKYLELVIGYEL